MTHGVLPCYVNGTRIKAQAGLVSVEDLAIGDHVAVLRDGQEVLEPVKWIGVSTVDLSRHAYIEDAAPIRIRKDAIAGNVPSRDLVVSPEHCLIIDDVCVAAKLLTNGGSIVSERDHGPFKYFHVELDRHGILLAENAPAESYLNTGNIGMFDNGGVPRHLHPVFKMNFDAARWQADACAPLASDTQVEEIWTRLSERSVQLGFSPADIKTENDADLHLLVDGKIVRPVSDRDARFVFVVPAGASSVALASRFCIPADKFAAGQRDTRRLGVRVEWISIRAGAAETILSSDHPALTDGWHDAETDGLMNWRWTDGSASIPWNNIAESAVLTVRCSTVDAYPVYDQQLRLVA